MSSIGGIGGPQYVQSVGSSQGTTSYTNNVKQMLYFLQLFKSMFAIDDTSGTGTNAHVLIDELNGKLGQPISPKEFGEIVWKYNYFISHSLNPAIQNDPKGCAFPEWDTTSNGKDNTEPGLFFMNSLKNFASWYVAHIAIPPNNPDVAYLVSKLDSYSGPWDAQSVEHASSDFINWAHSMISYGFNSNTAIFRSGDIPQPGNIFS